MPHLQETEIIDESISCKVLSAALDLFVENGYHNVSIQDIQRNAKVSIGSIYNHFGGKEGVAKALYEHLLNELIDCIDEVKHQSDNAEERCALLIGKLFHYTETHTTIISFLFNSKHREFLHKEPPICSAQPFKDMRDIIMQGMENGDFRSTNQWIASSLAFGPAIRMIQLRLDGLIEEPLTEYIDEIVSTSISTLKVANEQNPPKKSMYA